MSAQDMPPKDAPWPEIQAWLDRQNQIETRKRLGLPPIEKVPPRWTEEEIAATKARMDAAAEAKRQGPLPPDLRDKNVYEMSPRDRDRAEKALGLPGRHWDAVERDQATWEAARRATNNV